MTMNIKSLSLNEQDEFLVDNNNGNNIDIEINKSNKYQKNLNRIDKIFSSNFKNSEESNSSNNIPIQYDSFLRHFNSNFSLNSNNQYNIQNSNQFNHINNQTVNPLILPSEIQSNIEIEIESEEKKEEEKENNSEESKTLGRKRKDSLIQGKHDKFSSDNLYRKIKSKLLDILYDFINYKINEIYKDIPYYNIKENKLKKIEQEQVVNSHIEYNQKFLFKTLKEIFSVDISHKYKRYDLGHNKNVIDNLLEEKNNERREIFTKLLNKNFLECLEHFRGTKIINELEGLMTFDEFKEKYIEDADYLSTIEYTLMNYEEILNNKKIRKKRIRNDNIN